MQCEAHPAAPRYQARAVIGGVCDPCVLGAFNELCYRGSMTLSKVQDGLEVLPFLKLSNVTEARFPATTHIIWGVDEV